MSLLVASISIAQANCQDDENGLTHASGTALERRFIRVHHVLMACSLELHALLALTHRAAKRAKAAHALGLACPTLAGASEAGG